MARSQGGRSFQFRDAPVDLVLNQVLGEAFGLSFAIDPNVQGRLTIRLDGVTDGPSAVAALDAALRLQNIKITQSSTGYSVSKIDSGGNASGDFQVLNSPTDKPTGDAAVLMLRYANPDEVTRLAKPLLAANVVKLTDPSRGMIVLQGSQRDVAAAVDALRSFDVDWFAATSSAFVELQNAAPEEMKRELDLLVGRTGGVEVVALPRLAALMVFARSRELLDRTQGMIAQLDQERKSNIQNDTLIYEAKYVSAQRLKAIVGSLYFSETAASVARPPSSPSGLSVGQSNGQASPLSSVAPLQNGSVSVAIDELSNLVVVQADAPNLERISDLFGRVDRPQKQVVIEATIVEVSLRDEFRFGIQWAGVADFLNVAFSDVASGAVASKFPGLSIVYSNIDIAAVLNALDTKTDVQVVSSPRILALNNEPARIQVGDQVPIVTQSAVSVSDPGAPIVNSTTYRDTGVILEVTPRVRAGDIVEIKIAQEVSDVAQTVTSGIDSPTISQRRLESVLAVPNGATIALGGLISSNRSKSENGVPLLRDIPLIDNLFESKANINRRTELIVLLRPTILSSDQPEFNLSQQLAKALNRVNPSWNEPH